jgi:hypothetical protein
MGAIRESIIKKAQGKLFNHLKAQPLFKDWKLSDLRRLSNEIVENNDRAYNRFLDEKKFTLGETNTAIDSVLQEVLILEIAKLRI